MRRARAILIRLASFFRRRDADLSAEIESHIELHIEDNLRAGMSVQEARREAVLKLGGIEATKEHYRDQRGVPFIEQFLQDLHYGLRQLRRRPGFTATSLIGLALGIGATTAIFSVVNTVLLKPLGIADPDRFVILTTREGSDGDPASPAKFEYWRGETDVLEDVSAIQRGSVNTGGQSPERWLWAQVSKDAFKCWGMRMLKGRGFTAEEEIPDGPSVTVISEDLWMRRFASDPEILGKAISLNGVPHTVVGIVRPGTARQFGPREDVYVPFQIDPNTTEQGDSFEVVAHLKPGISLKQARSRLETSTASYRLKFPTALGPKDTFSLKPIREAVVGDAGALLELMLGAVSLVLLIACANVANLLAMQAAGRKREIAIRAAIGAGKGRMIRQLLTESMLLSTLGGALGVWLGYGGIRALLAFNTAELPLVGTNGDQVTMDWRVMTFAVVVSLTTGIVFGLFPALQNSRIDLSAVLKDSVGHSGASLRQTKVRAALVVGEISLAMVLLVGSALMIRSFAVMYAVDPGLATKNVFTMDVLMAGPALAKTDDMAAAVRHGLERIRSIPGVAAAGATCCLPLAEGTYDLNFDIVGRTPGSTLNDDVGWAAISPGYFDAYKIPVKRGRTFTDRDDHRSAAVVMISEGMAERYWRGSDPLRDKIVIGKGTGLNMFKDEPVRQVIGIVGDVRTEGLDSKPRPVIYVPQAQLTDTVNSTFFRLLPMGWVVRTRVEPRDLMPTVRDELQQATGLLVTGVSPMGQVAWAQTARQRFNLLLMTIFGGCALLLAMIGVYGLMAYTVVQQTPEIGIRLALGAEASTMRRMVVRQGMSLALTGVAIGSATAWGTSRLLVDLLFGVNAHDPTVFVIAPVILSAVALAAVWPSAVSASRVDPAESLRYQ